jgi:hypothetical protein
MSLTNNRMIIWFLRQTRLLQYFILAVIVHLAVLVLLGTVKVAAFLPQYIAAFDLPGMGESSDTAGGVPSTPDQFQYQTPQLTDSATQPAAQPSGQLTRFLTELAPSSQQNPAAAVVSTIGVHSDTSIANIRAPGLAGVVAPPTLGSVVSSGTSTGTGGSGSSTGRVFPGGTVAPAGSLISNRTAENRARAVQQFGGADPRIENAVLGALRYFQKSQQPNGSWGAAEHTIGITALVTLAFLGHGETPDSEEFGRTVDRALRFLVNSVGADGRLVVDGKSAPGREGYQIPLVTLALSEALVMTKASVLQPPLNKLVQQIVTAQNVRKEAPQDGGWRYSVAATDSDLSVTGWMIMALKSARDAGINIPPQTFTKAEKYVVACFKDNRDQKDAVSGFSYQAGGQPTPAMTGVGVLCMQFLGASRDSRIQAALDYLSKTAVMDWKEGQPARFPLYAWYYCTQSFFHAQSQYRDGWPRWNRQMVNTLVTAQKPDGSWAYPANVTEEPGHSGARAANESSFYATALCTLMLETYYRYLPIYQHVPPPLSSTPSSSPLIAMDHPE